MSKFKPGDLAKCKNLCIDYSLTPDEYSVVLILNYVATHHSDTNGSGWEVLCKDNVTTFIYDKSLKIV